MLHIAPNIGWILDIGLMSIWHISRFLQNAGSMFLIRNDQDRGQGRLSHSYEQQRFRRVTCFHKEGFSSSTTFINRRSTSI